MKKINWGKIFLCLMSALVLIAATGIIIKHPWGIPMLIIVCALPIAGLIIANLGVGAWMVIAKLFKIESKSNIVDISKLKPGQELRKIDKLATEQFEGNIGKAIEYVMRTMSESPELNEYVKEFTQGECTFASNVLYDMAEEKHGKGYVKENIKFAYNLEQLEMSEADIRSSEKNPFVQNIKRDSLILLCAVIVIGIAFGILPNYIEDESIAIILTCVSGVVIFFEATNLSKYIVLAIKYKKTKQHLDKNNGG